MSKKDDGCLSSLFKLAIVMMVARSCATSFSDAADHGNSSDKTEEASRYSKLNPIIRALTAEEIGTARKVFGDEMDYEKIKVHKGIDGLSSTYNSWYHPNAAAFTDGEHDIYINKSQLRGEEMRVHDKTLVAHELAHLFQEQKDLPHETLDSATVAERYRGDYDNTYARAYTRKNFLTCNREQQATVVEDYVATLRIFDADMKRMSKKAHTQAVEDRVIAEYQHLCFIYNFCENALPLPSIHVASDQITQARFNYYTFETPAKKIAAHHRQH